MAYSELIKNIERVREYVREFYVYGFRGRDEFGAKSGRSYDNERRRLESWLGEYMSFRWETDGKKVFLSVDSRDIRHNPLYKAFKAKSFTDLDIMLHFYMLDVLAGGEGLSVSEIGERIGRDYLARFSTPPEFDESTLRNKLREYEELGLLNSEKSGRQLLYRRAESLCEPGAWGEAASFYSEAGPLGLVGSYLLDRIEGAPECFVFKHHYILYAMESEILYRLLIAIGEKRRIGLKVHNMRRGRPGEQTVFPMKIYVSTQNGRQHLLAYGYRSRQIQTFRIDTIRDIKFLGEEPEPGRYETMAWECAKHLWGVSVSHRRDMAPDHLEMTIAYGEDEQHIPARLEREKRCGHVELVEGGKARFVADVSDAMEMLPWLRTFIGRIVELKCSNESVTEIFWADFDEMAAQYGGAGETQGGGNGETQGGGAGETQGRGNGEILDGEGGEAPFGGESEARNVEGSEARDGRDGDAVL